MIPVAQDFPPSIRYGEARRSAERGGGSPAWLEMLTDGKDLFVDAAGLKDVINASRHGQLAMRDLIGLHLRRVEWDKDGFVARLCTPFTRSRRTPADEALRPREIDENPLGFSLRSLRSPR